MKKGETWKLKVSNQNYFNEVVIVSIEFYPELDNTTFIWVRPVNGYQTDRTDEEIMEDDVKSQFERLEFLALYEKTYSPGVKDDKSE